MSRFTSLSTRARLTADQSGDVAVLLARITHPSLPAPVLLSSDPTQRFSADPLAYGTMHAGEAYQFVLMGSVLPDDQDKAPPRTTLVFENVDADMAAVLRSISSPARIDLMVVLAATPDVVEVQFTDLQAVRGSYDAGQVSLDISREPFTSEPMPAGRMSKNRFAGLHA